MILLVLYIFSLVIALGVGVLAAVSDFKGMTISNWLPAIVAAAYVVGGAAIYFSGADVGGDIVSHLLSGLAVFVVTFILFVLRMIGGGDSKLLSAYALWFDFHGLMIFLLYTTFLGGILGAVALFLKRKPLVKNPAEGSWIARVQAGESAVPYGIPIAIGAALAFLFLGYASPATLSLFLVSGT